MDNKATKRRDRPARDYASTPTLRIVYTSGAGPVRRDPHPLEPGTTLLGRAAGGGLVINDDHASREHAEVAVSDEGDWEAVIRDLGSFNGTYVNGRHVTSAALDEGDVIRIGDALLVYRRARQVTDAPVDTIAGQSPAMRGVRSSVELVAESTATVILLGETGTGKEVVARAIHARSGRAGPFVAVNCSAIVESLAESQLFGHIAGSFTGASHDHRGYFEAADGGTLFLDELGDLPGPIQPKLLRVLEERRVMPVGGSREVCFDARIVCATESKLHDEVQAAQFRGALYARLAEMTIELPPLRGRREDVLLLLEHLYGERLPPVSPRLAEALLVYAWPFNVRELAKLAGELRLRGRQAPTLTLEMVQHRLPGVELEEQPEPAEGPGSEAEDSAPEPAASAQPAIPTKDELVTLARAHGGNVSRIAKDTGRSRRQVYRWLEEHGLTLDDFRDG